MPPALPAIANGIGGHTHFLRKLWPCLHRHLSRLNRLLSMHDRGNVFRWFSKPIDLRSSFAISILTEPKWQPFHSDRRFTQAVRRMLTNKLP